MQMAEEDQSGAHEGFAHVVCPEIVHQIESLSQQFLSGPSSGRWVDLKILSGYRHRDFVKFLPFLTGQC